MFDRLLDVVATVPAEAALAIAFGLLLLCGLGLPIPEEIPLFAIGYFSYQDSMAFPLPVAIALAFVSVLAGDSLTFWLGRTYGHRIFAFPVLRELLTPRRLKRVNRYFHIFGSRVVFVGRFMAGVRAPIFLSAGILRMRFHRFLLMDGLAALLSVPLLIWLAFHFGQEIDQAIFLVRSAGKTLLILGLALIAFIALSVIWIRRKKKRIFRKRQGTERSTSDDGAL